MFHLKERSVAAEFMLYFKYRKSSKSFMPKLHFFGVNRGIKRSSSENDWTQFLIIRKLRRSVR